MSLRRGAKTHSMTGHLSSVITKSRRSWVRLAAQELISISRVNEFTSETGRKRTQSFSIDLCLLDPLRGRCRPHSGWVFLVQVTWPKQSLPGMPSSLPLSWLQSQSRWPRTSSHGTHRRLFISSALVTIATVSIAHLGFDLQPGWGFSEKVGYYLLEIHCFRAKVVNWLSTSVCNHFLCVNIGAWMERCPGSL